MSISYPIDLLADFPGTTTKFELSYVQEISPTRGGRQNSVDLGPALWTMDVKSVDMRPSQLKFWKARLAALENGAQSFNGYDLTAGYPIAYPKGSWPTGASFNGIASLDSVTNSKRVTLGGLPVGFKISTGDYISFDYGSGTARALHQAMQDAVADETGMSAGFEVRPYIRVGYTLDSDVELKRPHGVMVLVPGSVSAPSDASGIGSISFSAIQTLG